MLKALLTGIDEEILKDVYNIVRWGNLGYDTVDLAFGEKDALKLVKSCDYDLLICLAEDFSWEKVCKSAKQCLGKTDLILLCKNEGVAVAKQAFSYGATGFFAVKDVKGKEFSALLEDIYSRRRNASLIGQFLCDEHIAEQIYFQLNGNNVQYFESLFDELSKNMADKEIVRAVCVKLIGIIYDYLESRGFKNAGVQRITSIKRLGEIPYLPDAIKYTKDRYINMFQFETEKNQNYYYSITENIKKYIINNYAGESLDVPKIAERFHFSANYINGIFKSQTGETIPSFITNLRLGEAKKLLTGTKIPISEIATIVGYSRLTYFSRIFKRKYNISPNEYRNKFSE